MRRHARSALLIALTIPPAFSADWNPKLAAQYLDSRQQQWFDWAPAKSYTGTPCISCHTGLTYLLARPALRRALGEPQPTAYEKGLLDALRSRVSIKEGKPTAIGVESVLSAFFLTRDNAQSAETRAAFDRLWALQLRAGDATGSWTWFNLNLEPYEVPESRFFGATIAALALAAAPTGYRKRPEVRERAAAITAYLQRELPTQPLHNQLFLLWSPKAFRKALPDSRRQSLLKDIWSRQQPGGGWTLESLGPFRDHPDAPSSPGPNNYATGLAAFTLQKAGVPRSDPRLKRALRWLASRQDPQTGAWAGVSMNKQFPEGSMQSSFMRDMATAYATLALLHGADALPSQAATMKLP